VVIKENGSGHDQEVALTQTKTLTRVTLLIRAMNLTNIDRVSKISRSSMLLQIDLHDSFESEAEKKDDL
jgi:hypothetical protein